MEEYSTVCACGGLAGVEIMSYIEAFSVLLKIRLKASVGWTLLGQPDPARYSCFEGCNVICRECLWWKPVPQPDGRGEKRNEGGHQFRIEE